MKNLFASMILAAGMGTASVIFSLGAAQAADCGKLPLVDWWVNSPDAIRTLIDEKFDGNWDTYITEWKKYHTRMQRVLKDGGTAEVKSRHLRLSGNMLEAHIRDIEQRLKVLECMKAEAAAGGAKTETAVKSLPRFDRPVQVDLGKGDGNDADKETGEGPAQVASIDDGDFQLEVSAQCKNGEAVFQVTNVGEKWPRLGAISIHRTDTDALLSKRRMRLNNSQQATFRVRKSQVADVGEVGLWIEPSWFDRKFHYDAKIVCH